MRQKLSFVILSTGAENLKHLKEALTAEPRVRLLAGGEDLDQFYGEVVRLKPSAAIVTLGPAPEAAFELIGRISEASPNTVIICASADHSSELILRSLRAGAHEFLRLPIIAEEFQIILDRTAAFFASLPASSPARGRVVAVFSNKGGCGTSFIAANLAAAFARPTVIVDLNLQAGDLDLYLGLQPKRSIDHLAQHRDHLDEAVLADYVAPLTEHLSLLSAPRESTLSDEIGPEDVFQIIELLRAQYDYVVLDPQHTFDVTTLAALDQADDLVLVLTPDIPAVRSAQRTLAIFDRLGFAREKVHIVVNRWSKMIELDLREVERCLGRRMLGSVQSHYRSVASSINLGSPLVVSAPSSPISAQIRRIAAGILEGAPETAGEESRPQPQAGFWRKLLRRPFAWTKERAVLHPSLEKASKL